MKIFLLSFSKRISLTACSSNNAVQINKQLPIHVIQGGQFITRELENVRTVGNVYSSQLLYNICTFFQFFIDLALDTLDINLVGPSLLRSILNDMNSELEQGNMVGPSTQTSVAEVSCREPFSLSPLYQLFVK